METPAIRTKAAVLHRASGSPKTLSLTDVYFSLEAGVGQSFGDRLVGLVASKAEEHVFESRLRQDFSGSSPTSDLNIGTQRLPCQAPGVIGSVLGLVGPVSVYCEWMRSKV